MPLIVHPGMWSREPEIRRVYPGDLPEFSDQRPAQHTMDTTIAESRTCSTKVLENSGPPSGVPGYTETLPILPHYLSRWQKRNVRVLEQISKVMFCLVAKSDRRYAKQHVQELPKLETKVELSALLDEELHDHRNRGVSRGAESKTVGRKESLDNN